MLPDSMENLSNLECLTIIDSGLEFIPNKIFHNKKLTWVDLRGNNLKDSKIISELKNRPNIHFAI